ALDLGNQALILDWIARLAHERALTVVFTTHHPHHALAIADDALLMMADHAYVCGAANAVLSEANLEALYGVPLKHVAFEHRGRVVRTVTPVLHYAADDALSGDRSGRATT